MNNEIDILLPAMQEAGEAILKLQKTGFSIERKSNNDIVTKADLLANEILKTHLMRHFPDDGWLSEESVDDAARLTCDRAWIVDPIDGTKEYATGVDEYAISVALVEKGIPVVSSVYNPATNELFYAAKDKGAWLGKQKIQCHPSSSTGDLFFLASRSEYARGEWDRFKSEHRVKQVGSIAYKLALVAAGYADATFSLGPKNEWDIAAGTLLVIEAGGIVTDKKREPLTFNQENVLVNGIVATAAGVNSRVFGLIG